jgi:hypothetical protein
MTWGFAEISVWKLNVTGSSSSLTTWGRVSTQVPSIHLYFKSQLSILLSLSSIPNEISGTINNVLENGANYFIDVVERRVDDDIWRTEARGDLEECGRLGCGSLFTRGYQAQKLLEMIQIY